MWYPSTISPASFQLSGQDSDSPVIGGANTQPLNMALAAPFLVLLCFCPLLSTTPYSIPPSFPLTLSIYTVLFTKFQVIAFIIIFK